MNIALPLQSVEWRMTSLQLQPSHFTSYDFLWLQLSGALLQVLPGILGNAVQECNEARPARVILLHYTRASGQGLQVDTELESDGNRTAHDAASVLLTTALPHTCAHTL